MGPRGNSALDGGDFAASELWCQGKRLQDIVVMFLTGNGAGSPAGPGYNLFADYVVRVSAT